MRDPAHVLIALGLLVVVPLGLDLLDAPGIALLQRAWPVGGLAGALALVLETGRVAAALALVYAVVAVGAGLCALAELVRRRSLAAHDLAVVAALGYLPISAGALVADRLYAQPLGYSHDLVTLTAAHFVFAGFAASALSGLTARTAPSRVSAAACYGAVFGPAVVGGTFSGGPRLQLLGVVPLTVSLVALSVVTLRAVVPRLERRAARVLLRISALSVLAPMLLALDWTWGSATGFPHLSLEAMKATHGVLNAVGYALCGMAAWWLSREPATQEPVL